MNSIFLLKSHLKEGIIEKKINNILLFNIKNPIETIHTYQNTATIPSRQ